MLGGSYEFCTPLGEIVLGEGEEEESAKGAAEESTVDGLEARVGGHVNINARRTEKLDGVFTRNIRKANRQGAGAVAVGSGAETKMAEFVLLRHLLDADAGADEALVNQTVEHLSGGLDDGEIGSRAMVSSIYASSAT